MEDKDVILKLAVKVNIINSNIEKIANGTKLQLNKLLEDKTGEKLSKSKKKDYYKEKAMAEFKVTSDQIDNYKKQQQNNKKKNKNNKKKNGKIENMRLVRLCDLLNTNPEYKKKIISSLPSFANKIKRFEMSGGMGNKHDLIAITEDGIKYTLEVKGLTNVSIKKLNSLKTWDQTPQLVAPQGKDCPEVFLPLAELYHNSLTKFKEKFDDLPGIPTIEDYIKSDLSIGSARTDFAKALKKKYENNKTEYLEIFENIYQAVTSNIINRLNNNPELKNQLNDFIQNQMITALKSKDLWLNIIYSKCDEITPTADNIVCYITPEIKNFKIVSITNTPSTKQKCFDLKIKTNYDLTQDNTTENYFGETRLRWSNGKGIANLMWKIG